MIYKRSGVNHNWTMTVNPGYKYVESFAGGITSFMMEIKDVIPGKSFKLKKINELLSFNRQSISFRLKIRES